MTRFTPHIFLTSVLLLTTAMAAPLTPAHSAPLTKEEVDTNKDGTVSPEESRAYILRLEQRAQEEALQKAQAAAQEAEIARKIKEAAPAHQSTPAVEPSAAQAATPPVAPVAKAASKDEKPVEMKKTVVDAPANDQKKLEKRLRDMKAQDLNNDGILQATELTQATSAKFDAADLNRDGILSPAEMETALEKFRTEQMEDYGTARGKQETLRLKNRLKNADNDHNGQLSRKEYEGFMNERHSLYDRDGDGIITEEEYRTDGEKLPSTYRKKPRE